MSFYGSGQGGWFKAGDIVISVRDDIEQTGQKLLIADGSVIDPVAYPDLAGIFDGDVLPDYTASPLSYMVVAENAPLVPAPDHMIETAMYSYAGEIVVSHNDFLEDGRNLVPCDGGAIDVRFTDLTAIKIDGILPDYKHSGVPYRVVAQNPGTSGIADYSHIDNIYSGQPLTWAHETGGMTATVQNGGTTSIKSGGSYGVHYTEDLLSHDYGGSEEVWWELEVISITRDDRTSIGFRTDKTGGYSYEASGNYYLINTDGIAILTTTSGNLIVDLETTTIPDSGLNPGDLFAFKLNNTTKWVTMYKNGVLLPNTFRVSVASELYFIVGTGSSSCTWEVNLRTMESRDNHTYLD